jgi:hypothetical protein
MTSFSPHPLFKVPVSKYSTILRHRGWRLNIRILVDYNSALNRWLNLVVPTVYSNHLKPYEKFLTALTFRPLLPNVFFQMRLNFLFTLPLMQTVKSHLTQMYNPFVLTGKGFSIS